MLISTAADWMNPQLVLLGVGQACVPTVQAITGRMLPDWWAVWVLLTISRPRLPSTGSAGAARKRFEGCQLSKCPLWTQIASVQ